MRPRSALTLVEVMIAMTLFGVVMVAVIQAMTAVMQYRAVGDAEDDLNQSGIFVMRAISDDLYASGWNIVSVPPMPPAILPTTWATDRATLYYPYAVSQGGNLGSLGPHHTQNVSVYDWFARQNPKRQEYLRAGLSGSPADFTNPCVHTPAGRAAFFDSYFGRSVSLVFVKSLVDEWGNNPESRSRGRNEFRRIDFGNTGPGKTTDAQWATVGNQQNLNISYASPWQVNASGVATQRSGFQTYGVEILSGKLDLATRSLLPVWEGIVAPQYDSSAVQMQVDLIPREYMYCVVPSPLGVGRLVRAHLVQAPTGRLATVALTQPEGIVIGDVLSQGVYPLPQAPLTVGMVVDSILSDDVTRLVFETIRTQDPTISNPLAINQVRMRLYLARVVEGSQGGVVKSIIDTVVTMRVGGSAAQVLANTLLVPALPGGFQF